MEEGFHRGFFSRPYGRSFFFLCIYLCHEYIRFFFGRCCSMVMSFFKNFFRSRLVLLIDCPSRVHLCFRNSYIDVST